MKRLNKYPRNVQIFAVNAGNRSGFNIYISLSGQCEFLYYHRHNGLLYKILEKGIYIETLYRWRPNKMRYYAGKKLERNIRYLIKVVEDYFEADIEEVA